MMSGIYMQRHLENLKRLAQGPAFVLEMQLRYVHSQLMELMTPLLLTGSPDLTRRGISENSSARAWRNCLAHSHIEVLPEGKLYWEHHTITADLERTAAGCRKWLGHPVTAERLTLSQLLDRYMEAHTFCLRQPVVMPAAPLQLAHNGFSR